MSSTRRPSRRGSFRWGLRPATSTTRRPDRERERKLNEIWAGKYQCVSNVNLFTEGTDWPECSCVVLARGTGSLVQYRQMNGRAMRRKEDGGDAVIIDLAGNVHVHGMPDSDIEWSLEYGVEAEAKKGLKDSVRRCEWCQHMYPRVEPECPLCGTAPLKPEVLEVDSEIEEVTEAKAKKRGARPTKRLLSQEIIETGGDLEKLRILRAKYGYHSTWPARMKQVYKLAWRRTA